MYDFKKMISFINHHTGAFTVVLATAGFIVAYLEALFFANGQVTLANYLINEVGVVAMWTNSVVLIGYAIVQTIFILLLISNKGDIAAKYGWFATIVAWIFIWTIVPILFFATLGITLIIIVALNRWSKNKSKKDKSIIQRKLFIFIITCTILLGITNFPTLPSTLVEFNSGKKEVITIIASKDRYVVAVYGKSKKIKQIPHKYIKRQSLCNKNQQWYYYNLSEAIDKSVRKLDECPDRVN